MRNFLLSLFIAAAVLRPFAAPWTSAADEAPPPPAAPAKVVTATFAGGCFWCMEPPFDELEGVVSTVSGYTGGTRANPDYHEVSEGHTGHAEAVQITYDPAKIGYEALLKVFWRNVDPTTPDRQFCDRGNQYRSAIFYGSEDERALAEKTKKEVEKRLGQPVVTEIVPAGKFYAAEDYHQDYYRKNPVRYQYYRYACGRDKRLEEIWGDEAPHARP